jgi:UDP-2,4-diacetamido-2,4,6-trideoxy-beta-L-altropyranose hydrolase
MTERLVIRADASVEIGTGHIMRCLALAQAWQERGGAATFIAHERLPAPLAARLQNEGMALSPLTAQPGSPADAETVIALARAGEAAAVVVDGYHFGGDYQRWLKAAGLRVLFVDDNGHAEDYSADWVLNQNVHAHAGFYTRREAYSVLLLGTPYTLLRREFRQWQMERETPSEARRVLVTIGGSDPKNVTEIVIEALRGEPYEVVVVVGGGHPNRARLEGAAARTSIEVRHDVRDMPALMAWADLAVTACGTTTWELALMQLPSVAIVTADNQQRIGAWLQAHQAALVLEDTEAVTPDAVRRAVTELAAQPERREHISRVGQSLVDGLGALRVVDVMTGKRDGLRLRPVERRDAALVWRWANDPQTRANSFNTGEITWQNHVLWFEHQLAAPGTRFWMLEDVGAPVGHIRYAKDDDAAVISFTVGEEYRGRGYGTRLLTLSRTLVCAELGVTRVRGVTITDNRASARAFEKAGFTRTDERVIDRRTCFIFEWECSA